LLTGGTCVVVALTNKEILRSFFAYLQCLDVMPNCDGRFYSGGEKLCLWDVNDLRPLHMISAMTVEGVTLRLLSELSRIASNSVQLICNVLLSDYDQH
jgi:hypothetical protein